MITARKYLDCANAYGIPMVPEIKVMPRIHSLFMIILSDVILIVKDKKARRSAFGYCCERICSKLTTLLRTSLKIWNVLFTVMLILEHEMYLLGCIIHDREGEDKCAKHINSI